MSADGRFVAAGGADGQVGWVCCVSGVIMNGLSGAPAKGEGRVRGAARGRLSQPRMSLKVLQRRLYTRTYIWCAWSCVGWPCMIRASFAAHTMVATLHLAFWSRLLHLHYLTLCSLPVCAGVCLGHEAAAAWLSLLTYGGVKHCRWRPAAAAGGAAAEAPQGGSGGCWLEQQLLPASVGRQGRRSGLLAVRGGVAWLAGCSWCILLT